MHAIIELHTVSHCSLRHVLRLAAPGSRFGHLWNNISSWDSVRVGGGVEGWMVGGPGGKLLQN